MKRNEGSAGMYGKIGKSLICMVLTACMLTAFAMPAFAMTLNIVTAGGQEIVLDGVEASDSIDAIKSKIHDKEGIAPDRQILYYNGVQLEDGHTLADYNIPDSATLELALSWKASNDGSGATSIEINGIYVAGAATADVIAADITWGAMNFTYTDASQGEWNPGTHAYEGATEAKWTASGNTITVANHSNVAITASFTFAGKDGITVEGAFSAVNEAVTLTNNVLTLASAVGTSQNAAPSGEVAFNITSGSITAGDTSGNLQPLGTIYVAIAKPVSAQ